MSTENVQLFLSPYAWVRIVAYNQSGAYKILAHGIDEKPYELIVPQFETGEVTVPEYGEGESFIYIFKLGANNETISGYLHEKINCHYRDTTVLNITF